jgi:chromosome condensin MukBEF ATPase and DNA-binding subunit MukB
VKHLAIIALSLAVIILGGCASIRAAQPPPKETESEYRDIQNDLQRQQTDIAITGIKVEEESLGIVGDIARLEESISTANQDYGEIDRLNWLRQVQDLREKAEGHQADIEKMNRQLAEEREVYSRLTHKFDEYETSQNKALSERDTENAQLRVENKAVYGQRNTLLAIMITAVSVIVLFVVFKILRAFKVIPF